MRIDIMTLFPETVGDMMNESILGRAQERGYIRIDAHQIRDYTVNKQKQVDDYPYGGGRGAVMQAALPLLGGHQRTLRHGPHPDHLSLPLRRDLLSGQGPAAAGGLRPLDSGLRTLRGD